MCAVEKTGIVNPAKTGFTVRCLVIEWISVSLMTDVDDQMLGLSNCRVAYWRDSLSPFTDRRFFTRHCAFQRNV